MNNLSLERRIKKSLRDKGILYSDFLGCFGSPFCSVEDQIETNAVEAGFLRGKDTQYLNQTVKNYDLQITDEMHPYYDAIKHSIGHPCEWVHLAIGKYSAKLTFCAGKFGNQGCVFNMIDGIHNFIETLCFIDSHGWNPEEELTGPGELLDWYQTCYYRKFAETHRK